VAFLLPGPERAPELEGQGGRVIGNVYAELEVAALTLERAHKA
jgi:hypothetical protein